MKKFSVIVFLLAAGISVSAQQDSLPLFKPYSLSMEGGMNFYSGLPLSLSDVRTITPNSAYLSSDLSSFRQHQNYWMTTGGSYGGMMLDVLNRKNQVKKHSGKSVFRVGFNYAIIDLPGPDLDRSTPIGTTDTVSWGNGAFYIDSTFRESYYFSWHSNALSADISQVFISDDSKLLSVSIGYGIQIGAGINNYLYSSYNSYNEIRVTYPPFSSSSGMSTTWSDYYSEYEYTRCKPVFYGRVYVPFTCQLRLSRKNNSLNKLALLTQLKTGMDFQQVNKLGISVRPFAASSFGIRYYFQNDASK